VPRMTVKRGASVRSRVPSSESRRLAHLQREPEKQAFCLEMFGKAVQGRSQMSDRMLTHLAMTPAPCTGIPGTLHELRAKEGAMDAMHAILTRRSVRRYTQEEVSEETVEALLKAAMSAPTATGEAWDFVVIRDRKLLDAVTGFHHHAKMLKEARVGIAVCGDPTREALKGRWPLDCAAATENILIAANALGLGACWVGIYPVEERMQGLRDLLSVPEHVVPLSIVSIGYPAEEKAPSSRYRPERVHHDRW
jgi:nitroreductase